MSSLHAPDHRAEAGPSRRAVIAGSLALAASAASSAARAAPSSGARDTLVFVFLRGGMDGLSLCAPYGDGDYYVQRPTIAIPLPGQGTGRLLDLDGFFGLAPSAAALLPAFHAGELAFVHTVGSLHPTRSHFEAMRHIERGTSTGAVGGPPSGWLGRHLARTPAAGIGTPRALALAQLLPEVLLAGPGTLPTPTPETIGLRGSPATLAARTALLAQHYSAAPAPLGQAGSTALASIAQLRSIDFVGYQPDPGVHYPGTELGQALRRVAAIVKADIGVECLTLDVGGWDDHDNLGPVQGFFAARLAGLADALAALHRDLGHARHRTSIVVMSEFGRRVDENGSRGADHGRAGCMLVLGGDQVNGGVVLRQWPGLAPAALDDGALPVRIDHRRVLVELLERRMGQPGAAALFPGYTHAPVGLFL